MHRPSWLRRKGKLKVGSTADPSRASSSAVSSKSELANDGVVALANQPAEQPKAESRRGLWDRAYDDLRAEKKDLVEAFENMLSSSHEANPTLDLGDEDPLKREKQMSALVHEKLATMNDKRWRIQLCGRSVVMREQVDRVVKVILVAKDFINPFANLDPVHAGLPWAGVCMLLQLMTKDTIQRAAAIDGLEYISKLVRRYTQIEQVYFQSEGLPLQEDLEAVIKKLYTQILEYEARAACQFNRQSGHQTTRNIFEADSWDSILKEIKKTEMECDELRKIIDVRDQQARQSQLEIILSQQTAKVNELLEASLAQDEALLAEIKAMRKDQIASFQNQEEMNCHKCFRTVDYENAMEKNPNRIPGTCEWFLRHPRYISWLAGQASNLLWVTADPGCGKSVLSKFLVHDYRSWMWKDKSICYFFFKDDSEGNRSATHALCSILHQLFLQNPALLKHAMPEFNSDGDKLSELFRSLWSILLRAAADADSGGIVCILDALDECSESSCKQLVEHLTEFQPTADGAMKIKFLITSRPNDLIWRTFSRHFSRHERDLASIQLMGENEEEMQEICAEINLLVDAKVKEFKKLRSNCGIEDDAEVKIKAKLDEIENRTYLWISLIFPELDELVRNAEDDLLERIKRIPPTVDAAYEKILSKSPDPHQARRLLHIVCAASRPFTLAEMNRALSIEDKNHMNVIKPPQAFGIFVRRLCGLFISIQNSRIYLIHQTAKEFLVRDSAAEESLNPITLREGSWKNSLEPAESHYVLAQICMSYFFTSELERDPLNLDSVTRQSLNRSEVDEYAERHDFLSYAAQEWVTHFRGAQDKQTTLSELALEICNPHLFRPFETWFQVYDPNDRLRHARRASSLHVASYLGLEEPVRLLLARNDVDASLKDRFGCTALTLAADRGHDQIVKLLLARDNIDPDPKETDGRTPLHSAAMGGHIQVIKLLLAQDNVDPDSKDNTGDTPLHSAAYKGHFQVVKLLLAQDNVDPNSKDENGVTPLHTAAMEGHIQVVKLLLAQDNVDLDSKDKNGATPLYFATHKGDIQVMELLLAQDRIDFNSKNINGDTPILNAVQCGHDEIVKSMLEKNNIDPNSRNLENQTPLSFAAESGRFDIVKLLLTRNDVDPDSKNINKRSPLSYAAEYGDVNMIELLLARNVDPDSKDIHNRTPLSWAAAWGETKSMELLFARNVDSDSKDINHRTPLSWAAEEGKWKVIKLLLARNVDPDSKDINNRTPLSWAAAWGERKVVKLLLARDDVDPDSTDNEGHTPMWWAEDNGRDEVVKLLRAKKAGIPLQVDSSDCSSEIFFPEETLWVGYGAVK